MADPTIIDRMLTIQAEVASKQDAMKTAIRIAVQAEVTKFYTDTGIPIERINVQILGGHEVSVLTTLAIALSGIPSE
jgi:hypothetical protein